MRFKCVSKSFETIISSPNFVQLYLRHNNSSDLLILPENNSIICYDIESSATTATFTRYDPIGVTVIGSACGLLCIRGRCLSILNPETRMRLDINYSRSDKELGWDLRFVGFAFDHLNLDFKIVTITNQRMSRKTKVYSLNTRSLMEMVITFPEDSIDVRYEGGVLVNKHLLHWMFWKPSSLKRWIGCFDVCQNNWVDAVLLPRYYYDPTFKNLFLDFGVLDGCLFSSFENRIESCYDVWVMKEYRVQDSWVKLFSIPVSDYLRPGLVPVACRGESGEILIRQRHGSRLFWYNRMDAGMSEAKFDRAPNFTGLQAVHMCSKSQVDIPGGKIFPN